MSKPSIVAIPEPRITSLIFADTRLAPFWLLLRIYVGWQWLTAGIEKLQNPLWVGGKSGMALHGFLTTSLSKSTGPHADVQTWYAVFLQQFIIPNSALFSYVVTFGEILVGIALILGIFTGIAAFFGAYMNMNYLLAGTISTNPILFAFELLLILGWRVAGWLGLDRYLLPLVGTPWQKGEIFRKKRHG